MVVACYIAVPRKVAAVAAVGAVAAVEEEAVGIVVADHTAGVEERRSRQVPLHTEVAVAVAVEVGNLHHIDLAARNL